MIIVACLILTNIYPVINMRTMLYESKKSEMQNQESVIASSLAPLGNLSTDEVEKVMYLIGDMELTRIIVTDTAAMVLYDSSDNSGNVGKYAMLPEILSALNGKTAFSYEFTTDATKSRASVPVMYRGKSLGAVYIYEYSTDEAELVMALRSNLWKISIAVFLASVLLAFLVSGILNGRLKSIVRAIKGILIKCTNIKI